MKVLVTLLGLITATLLSGVAAITLSIRAYSATGELNIKRNPFITLGTRVLLTCEVTGIPEGSEVVSYRWYHNCTALPDSRCEIRDRDPYYRVVKDTLLMDVTSLDQGGRYYCAVPSLSLTKAGITRDLAVANNPAPFLYTPTSLLPEHSVLTDVQQATGRNGQQWITCRSGGEGTRPEIWMGSEEVPSTSSNNNSAIIALGTQHPNELYHCLTAQSQREYFSLFLNNSVSLSTPTVSGHDTSMWTLTSPYGIQVERYIVEFECRVRHITFVEKSMSVSARGGTGQVATNASCLGGLSHLYKVKVWAVSGPNISPALICTPVKQCSEEDFTLLDNNGMMPSLPGNADNPLTPNETQDPNRDGQSRGTWIGVGVGVGVFLLLVLSTAGVLIVVVVVVKRKAVCKWNRNTATRKGHIQYTNTMVVMQEVKGNQKGAGYEDVDIYDIPDGYNLQNGKVEEDRPIADGCVQYENTGTMECTKTRAQKKSSTPARATIVHAAYTVTGMSNTITNQPHVKKPTEPEYGYFAKDNDLYAVPMMKRGRMTDNGEVVVVSGAMEEEQYDDTAQHTYRRW